MYESPAETAATLRGSRSTATTSSPASAKATVSGRPTYPSPITPIDMAADDSGPRGGRCNAAAARRYDLRLDRARRGASGALYPQSALAGLNPLPRGTGPGVGASSRGADGSVPLR